MSESAITALHSSPNAQFRPVPIGAWRLDDAFWAPRIAQMREVTLPDQWQRLVEFGHLDNFRRAAGADLPFRGVFFNDSDLYKWLEAANWALAHGAEPWLEARIDEAIALIAAAQRKDGYINTYFSREREKERWTNLDLHELYCAGHLIQAAVAHHRVTGSRTLLDIATKFANHLCDRFGPNQQRKQVWADGHQEIELALVELYRETGEARFLDQAQLFVDVRGRGALGRPYDRWESTYHQDHLPLKEMTTLEGHAVRAMYYLAGGADLALETGDPDLITALERLWEDTRLRKLYVSGGLGARHEGEAFGDAYELPNATAYAESCAAIGSVMFHHRMLHLTGDGRYADFLEYTLYNAVLPGIGLDGTTYFYENPLSDRGGHRRQPWYRVACCPPNIARTIAAMPGYAASVGEGGIFLHLYLNGTVEVPLDNGRTVTLRIATRYPWDGGIDISVDSPGTFALNLRIPTWAFGARLEVGDFAADVPIEPGGYATVRRQWRAGDTVHLDFPMVVRRIVSHPAVVENANRVALRRGPLLYAIEGTDHPDTEVRDLILPDESEIAPSWRMDVLGGMTVLTADAMSPTPDPGWDRWLYRTLPDAQARKVVLKHRILTAIPYFAWANRAPGAMQVWLRRASHDG